MLSTQSYHSFELLCPGIQLPGSCRASPSACLRRFRETKIVLVMEMSNIGFVAL